MGKKRKPPPDIGTAPPPPKLAAPKKDWDRLLHVAIGLNDYADDVSAMRWAISRIAPLIAADIYVAEFCERIERVANDPVAIRSICSEVKSQAKQARLNSERDAGS